MRYLAVVASLPALALLVAGAGASASETSAVDTGQPVAAPATPEEIAVHLEAPAGLGGEEITPVPVKKGPPNQETCPGEFDISRPSSFYDCTLEACNQWCVEEGGSYASAYAWILPASGGLCLCKCCP